MFRKFYARDISEWKYIPSVQHDTMASLLYTWSNVSRNQSGILEKARKLYME